MAKEAKSIQSIHAVGNLMFVSLGFPTGEAVAPHSKKECYFDTKIFVSSFGTVHVLFLSCAEFSMCANLVMC